MFPKRCTWRRRSARGPWWSGWTARLAPAVRSRAAALIDDDGLLVLVAVETEMHSPGILAAPLLDSQDGDAARLLAEAREQVPPDCAACLTVARRSDPAEVLTEVAREQRADLLVVGRRGRDFAARVLLGSVASRLIADAPCDVLVVR
jgi:nucleotide-binding universal stress UspA family protein